jgi:hypothetical protein
MSATASKAIVTLIVPLLMGTNSKLGVVLLKASPSPACAERICGSPASCGMTSTHAAPNSVSNAHARNVLNNHSHNINQVEAAIDDTIQNLGVGYLDLYHMHWPVRIKSVL